MASIVTHFAVFVLGLAVGAGLVYLGIVIEEKRRLRTLPPPLVLAPIAQNGTDAVTASVPPHPTYEPVYLTDADVARMESVSRGNVKVSHDTIEASKRGA